MKTPEQRKGGESSDWPPLHPIFTHMSISRFWRRRETRHLLPLTPSYRPTCVNMLNNILCRNSPTTMFRSLSFRHAFAIFHLLVAVPPQHTLWNANSFVTAALWMWRSYNCCCRSPSLKVNLRRSVFAPLLFHPLCLIGPLSFQCRSLFFPMISAST